MARLLTMVFCLALLLGGASCSTPSAVEGSPGSSVDGALMPDGKLWMVENLGVAAAESYCYADRDSNCVLYGRLYTWESARQACQTLDDRRWRLPTDAEWRELARHFGGVFDDAQDRSAAYHALLHGGRSGFDAVLSGGRAVDGQYDDLEAHGFYWTVSESAPTTALFYNFGRGSTALYRQVDGEKGLALAVRCVSG